MVRGISLVLAIGLAIVWIAGIDTHAAAWLTWLDGLASLFGFAIAAGAMPSLHRAASIATPMVLGIALMVLWIVALATGAQAWITWWTFAFACSYIGVGVLAGVVGQTRIEEQRPDLTRPI